MKRIISLVNIKSGSGSTTLALNLATAAALELGLKTAVLELGKDIFETQFVLKADSIYDVTKTKSLAEHFLAKEKFYLFRDTSWELTIKTYYNDIDILFIDSVGMQPQELFEISDVVLIPAAFNQNDISYANYTAKQIIDLRFPKPLINIIINKAESTILSITDMQQIFNGLKVVGVIPYVLEVKDASQNGELYYLKNKKDLFSKNIKAVAAEICTGSSKPHLQILNMLPDTLAPRLSFAPAAAGESGLKIEADIFADIRGKIHKKLMAELDVRNLEKDALTHPDKKAKIFKEIREKIRSILDSFDLVPSDRLIRENIVNEIFNEVAGFGAIEEYLNDSSISEIMVNRHDVIYIEKSGRLYRAPKQYTNNENVMRTIERIVMPLGRRIDESMPYVDARLPDGSRVNAIIPPLAVDGPVLTIRKFSDKKMTGADLISYKTLTQEALEYLNEMVLKRKNILISGGTGSGKTTLLNVISSFIPENERIITVEDSAELKLSQEHVIRLEARPANIEGKGAVSIRDLVKNCLRMRPDRIIVGECRSGETLDMLQAMNTGHDGSMTTVHANTPRDALSRVEVMVLMSGVDLPLRALREQIKSAINIVVQQSRMKDGSRKITHISEVTGIEGDTILMHDIFKYQADKLDNCILMRADRL